MMTQDELEKNENGGFTLFGKVVLDLADLPDTWENEGGSVDPFDFYEEAKGG